MHEKLEYGEISSLIKPRDPHSHKGNFGRVLLIAGSSNFPGAAALATAAALRSSVGIAELMTTERVIKTVFSRIPEAIVCPMRETRQGKIKFDRVKLLKSLERASAVVIGPGMGTGQDTERFVKMLITTYSGTLIIDADGINVLSRNIDILSRKKCNIILTPHHGEMARLGKTDVQNIVVSRAGIASVFAKTYGVYLVLKGHDTVIAAPDGETVENTTGNAGLSRGGSGDVLAGMITGLLGGGLAAHEAAVHGVYLHGLAGDRARRDLGAYSMIASDIITHIKDVTGGSYESVL